MRIRFVLIAVSKAELGEVGTNLGLSTIVSKNGSAFGNS